MDFTSVLTLWPDLLRAAVTTLALSVAAMTLALLVGITSAALGTSRNRFARVLNRIYVDLIRGTPLLVQLVLLFYLPAVLGLRFPAVGAGLVGLALYYGAYIAEIVRGGFASVPRGHVDAARALGMSRSLIFRHVVLPQVIAVVIPPLTGQFTAVVKGTSLLSVITIFELTSAGYQISVRTIAPVETWIVIAGIYLVLNGAIAGGSVLLEQRLRVGYR